MNNSNKLIILFDGVCNLCNTSVNFILKKDVYNKFIFTSLQSDAAKKLLLQFNDKIIKNNLDSILLIHKNKVYNKSTAILYILRSLHFPYNLGFIFIIIPKFIRDYIYDIIARNRYKWFGRKETCRIPTKEELNKFL
ncbi:MAG TPA: DUF393 domain-containing protein [Flavobacteriaceae bacterium]|nr:DUF393 domain-containing protein [Flavobacteriaceae bacterium]